MKIGETIKVYRKQQNLTQEQMAHALGVSTPAVNKWENDVSYPDITLLAPIARLLNIKLETLLSFRNDLTDEEINKKAENLVDLLTKDSFDKAFEYGTTQMQEYPNCDKLAINICKILQSYYIMKKINKQNDGEKYSTWIHEEYVRLAESAQTEVASSACSSLATEYMNKKEYDKAQMYLDRIPKAGFDKRMMQAQLYKNIKRTDEAYHLYEVIVYSSYLNMSMAMTFLSIMYCEDGDKKTGKQLAIMGQKIAEAMQLGKQQSYAPILAYAGTAKDPIMTVKAIKNLIGSIDSMTEIRKSLFFAHQPKALQQDKENLTDQQKEEDLEKRNRLVHQYKEFFKEALNSDEDIDFIRDNKEFQELVKEVNKS